MKVKGRHIGWCVIAVLLIFNSLKLSAQFGASIGPGISDIGFVAEGQVPFLGYEINSLIHNYPLPSFQGGVIYHLEMCKRLSFIPGMYYSRQGLNVNNTFLYDDITYRLFLNYLKVPLAMKLKTNLKKSSYVGIVAGPYVSGLIKASLKTEVNGILERRDWNNVNKLDFGAFLGYSWDPGQEGKLLLNLRCSYSLINMMKEIDGYLPKYYGPEKSYARNINIGFLAEYMI